MTTDMSDTITERVTQLTYLELHDCRMVTAVSRLCQRLPRLTTLSLREARLLTDEIWTPIGTHLTFLVTLFQQLQR